MVAGVGALRVGALRVCALRVCALRVYNALRIGALRVCDALRVYDALRQKVRAAVVCRPLRKLEKPVLRRNIYRRW